MKSNRVEINSFVHRRCFSILSVTMAVSLGICGVTGSPAAHAQSTVATIFGWAPAGETIIVHGKTSGAHRHSKANSKGRYSIGSLPLGVYSVTLEKDGKSIDTRSSINLTVGGGAEVDFACAHDQCAESSGS